MKHARLSPSSGDRWFACPGSISASDGIPNKTSVYAEEGTRAHTLLEMALRLECDPLELIDLEDEVQVEMAEGVSFVLDYTTQYLNIVPGSVLYPETRCVWGRMWGREDLFGTADVTLVAPDVVCMVDLKYGQGVVVEVEDNIQQMLYLLGIRAEHGPRPTYQITIIQPRARHHQGPVRMITMTDTELMSFADRARAAVEAAERPKAPRAAGEHCRWCPAAGVCPTLADHSIRIAAHEFTLADALAGDIMAVKPVENLTTEQIASLLGRTEVIQAWITALKAEAFGRASRGEPVPGYKLVLGKSNRAWDNPAVAQEALLSLGVPQDAVAPRTLVSPAQAEKVMVAHKIPVKSRAVVTQHIVKPAGAPTLAAETDPRPEHVPFSEFQEIPQ